MASTAGTARRCGGAGREETIAGEGGDRGRMEKISSRPGEAAIVREVDEVEGTGEAGT
jgi:hypothetical protein